MSLPANSVASERASPAWLRLFFSEYLVLILALAYFSALAPFTPGLATGSNFQSLLIAMLPLFVSAAGQTVVLITGGIDLSATSVMALSSVLGAMAMNETTGWFAGSAWAVPAGLAVMLGTGLAVGTLNGLAIAHLRMPAFIVTLTSMMFFSGLAIWLTRSQTIYGLPPAFNAIGGRLPITVAVAAVVGVTGHLMLQRTLWGRWLFAIGHNARAALVSGVPVAAVSVSAYAASGVCAAVAAVLYTSQAETGSPVLGQRMLLDVIAATVIGGTSLFGGKGKILWTLGGVLFIKLIDNSLNALDLSHFTIMMVKGGVILLAASIDAWRNRSLA